MPGKPHPERDGAKARWEEIFGSPPPLYLSVSFMEKAVAYEAQCRRHGGLSAATRKTLARIACGQPVAEASRRNLKPGAHLVREWNGRSYQVEVTDTGYRLDRRRWSSLTAIAKHITGTNWSGPRFFGLNRREGGGA
ncbi:hypothetical protein FIU86_13805 [Roseovarius sp. THAF9]|uniref:DUF2924 domain-containing protein n=1 Tax=Roseovarius sp. THAF9 TaxID=2587847 RepID=UPI001268633A|nr:DUF2924 domain-containing protein [Roseovarius sp. THAF9]QFT93920.1 hypothetical protein FIU86_13805 [Roseovarius sp. THAF9]